MHITHVESLITLSSLEWALFGCVRELTGLAELDKGRK